MGDLVLKGATSGQITLTPTGTAGTNTLTLPAKTGNIITSADTGTVTQTMLSTNVAGNGPAFSAYLGTTQTISNNTFTKAQINTEEFDTNSNFDTATNYRFTPTVAGYYQVTGQIAYASGGITGNTLCTIYKNGSRFKDGCLFGATSGANVFAIVSALINFNGSTDYVELYGLANGSGTLQFLGGTTYQCYFQASLVRGA